jgi:tetratricopeptide (TPR) repeat protein
MFDLPDLGPICCATIKAASSVRKRAVEMISCGRIENDTTPTGHGPDLGRVRHTHLLYVAFHTLETGTAFAHLRAGRYQEALLWAEKALRDQPRPADAAQAVALSSALVGDLEKAKIAIRRLLEIAPSRRISTALISKNLPPNANKARFVDILREAGMPE